MDIEKTSNKRKAPTLSRETENQTQEDLEMKNKSIIDFATKTRASSRNTRISKTQLKGHTQS